MSPPRLSQRLLVGSGGLRSLLLAVLLLVPAAAEAQVKSPAERLKDLEDSNDELRRRLDELEKELGDAKKDEAKKDGKDEPFYSDGVLTLGGVKFELGGKAEFLLVDPQSENDPVVGSTESPDPYFDVDKLRLEPRLLFSKSISVESELDFKPLFEPDDADILLRELYARYNARRPAWWFDLDVRLGLDDRFIQQSRRTKYYPFAGTAFWNRESALLVLGATLGDKDGRPEDAPKGKKQQSRSARLADEAGTEGYRTPMPAEGVGDDAVSYDSGRAVVVTHRGPFDFAANPGELNLFFSVGNGYSLGNDEIGQDGADFNQMIVDDRDLDGNLSIRELGFGAEYRRNFESLGEIGVMGFYYNDSLNDDSLQFLREDLTVVVPGGDPSNPADVVAGYGSSNSRTSYRLGVSGDYLLPLSSLLGEGSTARRGDGLRIAGQWVEAADGKLRRKLWHVQGSFRWSLPEWEDPKDGKKSRGLIGHKYFRSFEPVVRYGELSVNAGAVPEIPELWDREQLLVGLIVEVTSEVFLKAEYTFNWEDTGTSSAFPGPRDVANDELLLELLLQF